MKRPDHPLKHWMFINGETNDSLAAQLGCSPSMISFYINRRIFPTMERMVAIAHLTESAVMPNDFLPLGWNRKAPKKKRDLTPN
jgi:DNA-binding transcriptional regulator YdaS (Cro superfamily)